MPKKNKSILIFIIIIAAAVRLVALLKYGDFWDDEMFNFIYSQKPWPEGLIWWLWETNPPLHLLLLKIWFLIVPATEFFARLPSAIAGIASVYFVFLFGKNLLNEKTGLIAAAYLALHPYHIFWSATSRIYSLLMLLTLISCFIFYKIFILRETGKGISKWSAVVNLLLIFSHLTAAFVLGAQFLILLVQGKINEIKSWIKINLPAFLAGFAWVAASMLVKSNNNLSQAWFFNLKQNFSTFSTPLNNLFAGQYPLFLGIITTYFGLIVIIAATRKKFLEKNTAFTTLLLLTFFPVFFSLLLGVWHIKFILAVLPIFVLLFSSSLMTYLSPRLAAILLILFCLPGMLTLFAKTIPVTDWSKVEKFYENNKSGSSVFVYNNYILKPQIDRYTPGLAGQEIFLSLHPGLSYDEMVVKKNYLYVPFDSEKIEEWYSQKEIEGYDSLVLLQGENDYMHKLDSFLTEKGWLLKKDPEPAPICGTYNLYVFEKSK